ncbi:immunoglobulin-like domain-containing protein [Hungatella effluvii]|nr:immunoglobulin-like domain-containing protein [Hungatella effluvii]
MVRELGEEGREIPVTIPVRDRQYSDEEAKTLYDTVLPELADRILGGNESLEAVRGDLDLVRVLEPYGLTVRWESENAELVDSFGTVVNSGVSEEGEMVWLKAVLTDGAHTQEYDIRVTVMPPVLNGDEQLKEKVMEACRRLDTRQKTEKELLLPEEVDGKKLSYYRERDTDYTVIPFWGVLLAFLWAAREKMKEQNAKKQREQLLLLDYSEIVSKFMVFISAGMTIRTAWERIAVGYENTVQGGTRKPRPAYEEMCHTISQLKSGMAESRAYGEFGRRCGLQPYVKLAALLEQNRKTGSKNLKAALELELVAAFEQRKNLAKKLGEEAGTKLLLPLFLMLGVVMVMMVVPAFLAFY